MIINWPEIILLFCLSLPGAMIAVPRLIQLLLPNNTKELVQRISRLAILQTLFMVFIMSLGGSVLSQKTGLKAGVLEALLHGKNSLTVLQGILLPALIYGFVALVVFCIIFYGILSQFIDKHSFQTMRKVHQGLGLDGTMLYGGVVEEIIARWGLMNLMAFFGMLFTGQKGLGIIWIAILTSAVIFATSQLPAYFAAGCHKNKRFTLAIIILHLWLATVFGLLFWQYGLLAAILAHMFFHLGWSLYDKN